MESFYAPFNGWKLELLTLVDHINSQKNLFHYVINSNEGGVIHFEETDLRPNVGDFIKLKYYLSNDKKSNKSKINILKVELTSEIKSSLLKNTTGELKLKYKNGSLTYDYDEIINEQILEKETFDKNIISNK